MKINWFKAIRAIGQLPGLVLQVETAIAEVNGIVPLLGKPGTSAEIESKLPAIATTLAGLKVNIEGFIGSLS